MPTTVQIVNRYVISDNVAGAAVVFDAAAIDAHSPRTRANGQVVVATEALADGNHVMHIVPDPTSAAPVGPAVAEGLGDAVKRMFRSLDVNVAVRKGKITTLGVPLAQARNGTVWAATNPVRVELQPIYHRSPFQNPRDRTGADLTLIIVHQTAGSANIGGTLEWFTTPTPDSQGRGPLRGQRRGGVAGRQGRTGHEPFLARGPRYVLAWQDGGQPLLHRHRVVAQDGHALPRWQIDALLALLDRLRAAYPSIPANGVVGHMDVLTDASLILAGRDCPGFDFDWVLLEHRGLGLIPSGAAANLDMYGGFFRLAAAPNNSFVAGDSDGSRTWGGVKWPAPAPAAAPARRPPSPRRRP